MNKTIIEKAMKKKVNILLITLTLLSIIASGIIALVGHSKVSDSDQTKAYWRFKTLENGEETFNWWAFLAPIQLEGQTLVEEPFSLAELQYYEHGGKDFHNVTPTQEGQERAVAVAIAKAIDDTLNKIRLAHDWDYDKASAAVRLFAQPEQLKPTREPEVHIELFGTASPEAKKYGPDAILPGHLEPENASLAADRVNRTATIMDTLGHSAERISSGELQFRTNEEAFDARRDTSILSKMRYVRAIVHGITQRLEIKTIAPPIMIPIYLDLAIVLGTFLFRLIFGKKHNLPTPVSPTGPDLSKPSPTKTKKKPIWNPERISACLDEFAKINPCWRNVFGWMLALLLVLAPFGIVWLYELFRDLLMMSF